MSFFSRNTFSRSYARPGKRGALVFGEDSSSEAAKKTFLNATDSCDAIVVGAGSGLSTAAGFTYSGQRFDHNFADFRKTYGITDMYSGGFHPFPDYETYWAWWSRHILINRYDVDAGKPYLNLLQLLEGKERFVITTNVDHQFQIARFQKERLFYTQGDYGLIQCARNCSGEVHDAEALVREMAETQKDMRIPSDLVPRCPRCGAHMIPNLRIDGNFCEPAGWHAATERYGSFMESHRNDRVVYLELGVGGNTPVIIKYPFWNAVADNPLSTYVCVNLGESYAPSALAKRSILVDGDIAAFLDRTPSATEHSDATHDGECCE